MSNISLDDEEAEHCRHCTGPCERADFGAATVTQHRGAYGAIWYGACPGCVELTQNVSALEAADTALSQARQRISALLTALRDGSAGEDTPPSTQTGRTDMATAHSLLNSTVSIASDLWDHVETLEARHFKDRLQQIRNDLYALLDDVEGGEG